VECQVRWWEAERIGQEGSVGAEVLELGGERHLVVTRLLACRGAVDRSISRRADHDQRRRADRIFGHTGDRDGIRSLLSRNDAETQPKRLAHCLWTKAGANAVEVGQVRPHEDRSQVAGQAGHLDGVGAHCHFRVGQPVPIAIGSANGRHGEGEPAVGPRECSARHRDGYADGLGKAQVLRREHMERLADAGVAHVARRVLQRMVLDIDRHSDRNLWRGHLEND
jgi:hypothetical protein